MSDVAEPTEEVTEEVIEDVTEESSPSTETDPAQDNSEESTAEGQDETPTEEVKQPAEGEIRMTSAALNKRLERARRQERERLKAELAAEVPTKAPEIDDFEDIDEFEKARIAYIAKQTLAEERRAQAEALESERKNAIQADYNRRVEAFQANHSDFAEVSAAIPLLDTDVRDAIIESDNAPEVIYHLGKHPELADRIAEMSPKKAIMELGKIEARLNIPAQKRTTRAPKPIAPVGGNKKVNKSPAEMTMEEYQAWRNPKVFGM